MATDIQISGAMTVPSVGAVRAVSHSVPAIPPDAAVSLISTRFDLMRALDDLADHAAQAGAELNFRVDEDSGRVIVSVIDARDGTVLRQMPSEEALRIARSLARFEPHLIEVSA